MKKNESRGFVLLMTLVIIAIAACAMSRIANQSLLLVNQGAKAEAELQERWLLKTAQLTLLDQADQLLATVAQKELDSGYGWPFPATFTFKISIQGTVYSIHIEDEDAKLNINWLYRNNPERLRQLLAQSAVNQLAVRIKPHSLSGDKFHPNFTSIGQYISIELLHSDRPIVEQLAPVIRSFTCWGDPAVNITRANDQTLRWLLDNILKENEIERLLQARKGFHGELEPFLDTLDIPRARLVKAKPLLSTESSCYSFWISKEAFGRFHNYLIVKDVSPQNTSRSLCFEW